MSLFDDIKDKVINKKNPNTKNEKKFVSTVLLNQQTADSGMRKEIEPKWNDEYLCFKGDQWDTSIAPRPNDLKSIRPNIVLNVVLPTVMNIVDALTTSTPQPEITGREVSDKEMSLKLSDCTSFVFERNEFGKQWKDTVVQGIKYGPFIGSVLWDPKFTGGAGPNRWVGEIRTLCQKKEEIYFDPAILDLEERLQECEFIHRKYRKKLSWIEDTWDNGKYCIEDDDFPHEESQTNEGADPKQATVIECWHKRKPKFVSEEQKQKFNEKADEYESKGFPFKAKEYRSMANGEVDGIHCAYVCGSVLLEYIPYVYDDGLYPFVYAVLYQDEKNPHGFGEIRNILNPQIMYNKIAEMEMESASVEGLGGYFFRKGALSRGQIQEYKAIAHQGGVLQEVNDPGGLQKREGTQTPQSLVLLKQFFKENIDTISQNTAIMQGVSPGANVPYASVQALGNRADVRNKGKMEILERFMTQFIKLVVSRIGQFYNDEREYRIRGNKSMAIKTLIYDGMQQLMDNPDKNAQLAGLIQLFETISTMNPDTAEEFGTFSNKEMKKTWKREKGKMEEFIPELDVKVKISDERPTSRSYFEQIAMTMYGKALGPKGFWQTIDEGKFPPVDEILAELKEMQQQAMAAQAKTTPPPA